MYTITFSPEAEADLAKLKRSEPASFKKAVKLLNELVEHPRTGTGHPEPLKGKPENRWSPYRFTDSKTFTYDMAASWRPFFLPQARL